jgi:hypothetical protein
MSTTVAGSMAADMVDEIGVASKSLASTSHPCPATHAVRPSNSAMTGAVVMPTVAIYWQ